MSDYYGRKILIGVVTGTLLSTAVASVLAENHRTYHLIDSQGNPVLTKYDQCVETPKTPNQSPKPFKRCGDVIDKDGDGIDDDEDHCPDDAPEEIIRGVFQSGPYKGCPIDTDADGVSDYRDDCPDNTPLEVSKGVDLRGCPLDSDQDGVMDYKDICPETISGATVDEQGCVPVSRVLAPVKTLTTTMRADVLFDFDSADLTYEGESQLNEFLRNMDNIDFIKHVEVVGHTDDVGSEEYNQQLSSARAQSVGRYLSELGVPIDKITQWGEGELNPVADNETPEGQEKNRRVEITVQQNRPN